MRLRKYQSEFDQEFQIIYHTNFGAPLLQKESKLVAPVKHLAPMNAHAAEGLDSLATYAGPTKGFVEQVYLLETYADANQHTEIMLTNAAADRGVSMKYSTEQLPYLTIWKNTAAVEDGYVTGLEPGTGYPFNRHIERQFGRVPKLAPGQSRSFVIDVGIHLGKESVAAEAAVIEKISAGKAIQIDKQPPTPPAGQ